MPNFKMQEHEIITNQDKWLFLFKNMAACEEMPHVYANNKLFERVFNKSQVSKLNQAEQEKYRQSLKEHWDLTNSIHTAFDEGKAEAEGEAIGIEKGKAEGEQKKAIAIAKKLKAKGFDIAV
jgi:predicted transposase YdaD